MSDNTIDRNAAILQSLFFGRGNPVKHKLNQTGSNVSTELPLTKAGKIQETPTAKSHFKVGLESTLGDPKKDLAPSNLSQVTITSVAMQGRLFPDLDDGLDALPDLFFNSLGVVNDEIEAASGSKGQISLADILSRQSDDPVESKPASPKTKDSGKITVKDLERLGLDVERLEGMGLTLDELNKRGLKLSDLEQILEN